MLLWWFDTMTFDSEQDGGRVGESGYGNTPMRGIDAIDLCRRGDACDQGGGDERMSQCHSQSRRIKALRYRLRMCRLPLIPFMLEIGADLSTRRRKQPEARKFANRELEERFTLSSQYLQAPASMQDHEMRLQPLVCILDCRYGAAGDQETYGSVALMG